MALASNHELSAIEPTLSARLGRPGRLAIGDPGAGVGPMPFALSPAVVERLANTLKRSIGTPRAEAGIDSLVKENL